jgi:hypothetical protein
LRGQFIKKVIIILYVECDSLSILAPLNESFCFALGSASDHNMKAMIA